MMNRNLGKVIGLKVEHHDPEKDPKVLAVRLAGSMHSEFLKRKDSKVYYEEAAKLEQRVVEYEELLVRIQKRDAGEPVETNSRMDPMLTYQASAVQTEIKKTREKAEEFKQKADGYLEEAEDFHKESNLIENRIKLCR